MANFCTNCGAPVSGRFCTACGTAFDSSPQAPAASRPGNQGGQPHPPFPQQPFPQQPFPQQSYPQQPYAPGPVNTPQMPKTGGSALKVVLAIVGVLVLLGMIGVAGAVYIGYRAKQKIAELSQEYGITNSPSGSAGAARASAPANFPPSKGTGCRYLEGRDAARILGVAIERVEFAQNEAENIEDCTYWVTAAERQRLARQEVAEGVNSLSKDGDKEGLAGFEKLIGGALTAAIESSGDNKNSDFAFQLRISRRDGPAVWEKMTAGEANLKAMSGVDVSTFGITNIGGIGDKAAILPAGHSIMVLKGDQFFWIGFQQFVPGREKTEALAKLVAARL
jgi:hypothetical protein